MCPGGTAGDEQRGRDSGVELGGTRVGDATCHNGDQGDAAAPTPVPPGNARMRPHAILTVNVRYHLFVNP